MATDSVDPDEHLSRMDTNSSEPDEHIPKMAADNVERDEDISKMAADSSDQDEDISEMAADSLDPDDALLSEELTVCCKCAQEDKTLKLLSCLHSACQGCLKEDGTKQFTCHKCENPTRWRATLDDLKDNFLYDASSKLKQLAGDHPCLLCETAGKSDMAAYVCFDCNNEGTYFCAQCLRMHSVMHPKHEPIATSGPLNKEDLKGKFVQARGTAACRKHSKGTNKYPLEFFCKLCKVPVCHSCLSLEHRSDAHDVVSLEDSRLELEEAFDSELDQVGKRMSALNDKIVGLEIRKMQCKSDATLMTIEVNERIAVLKGEILDKLDQLEEEYCGNIDETCAETSQAITDEIQRAERNRKCVENTAEFATAFKNVATDLEFVQHSHFISTKLGAFNGKSGGGGQGEAAKGSLPVTFCHGGDALDDVLRSLIGRLERNESIAQDMAEVCDEYPREGEPDTSTREEEEEEEAEEDEPDVVKKTPVWHVELTTSVALPGVNGAYGVADVCGGTIPYFVAVGGTTCYKVSSNGAVTQMEVPGARCLWDVATAGDMCYCLDTGKYTVHVIEIKTMEKEKEIPLGFHSEGREVLSLAASKEGTLYLASDTRRAVYTCPPEGKSFTCHIDYADVEEGPQNPGRICTVEATESLLVSDYDSPTFFLHDTSGTLVSRHSVRCCNVWGSGCHRRWRVFVAHDSPRGVSVYNMEKQSQDLLVELQYDPWCLCVTEDGRHLAVGGGSLTSTEAAPGSGTVYIYSLRYEYE